jgi:short chain dehydrogenase
MAALQGTAIVVGVGSEQGLGAALSRRFAREGYKVIVSGRTEAKLARVVRGIVNDGEKRRPSSPTRRSRRRWSRCSIGQRGAAPMASISWCLMRATMLPTIFVPCPRSFSSRRGVSRPSAGFWLDGKQRVAWHRVAGARSFSQVPPRVCAGARRLRHSRRPKPDYGRLRNRWRGNLDHSEFTSAMLSSMAALTAKS